MNVKIHPMCQNHGVVTEYSEYAAELKFAEKWAAKQYTGCR
jgi:hypothetical protein